VRVGVVVVVFRNVVTNASRVCTDVLRKLDQTSVLIKLLPTLSPVGCYLHLELQDRSVFFLVAVPDALVDVHGIGCRQYYEQLLK
jgi:hypothetical protein